MSAVPSSLRSLPGLTRCWRDSESLCTIRKPQETGSPDSSLQVCLSSQGCTLLAPERSVQSFQSTAHETSALIEGLDECFPEETARVPPGRAVSAARHTDRAARPRRSCLSASYLVAWCLAIVSQSVPKGTTGISSVSRHRPIWLECLASASARTRGEILKTDGVR